MKTNYLLSALAFIMLLASCGKENFDTTVSQDEKAEFKYSKQLTVADANGNSADVMVHANTMQAIDDHTKDALELITTTRRFDQVNAINSPSPRETTTDDGLVTAPNDLVFLEIVSHNFNNDITGFSLKSQFEALGSTNKATSYQYVYGTYSSGVHGVHVEYTGQTCNKEYLKTTLSVKTSPGDLFWGSLSSGKIYDVGDDWDYSGANQWYRYRLKVQNKKACNGTATYSYYWTF